jgi:hypothetical protein
MASEDANKPQLAKMIQNTNADILFLKKEVASLSMSQSTIQSTLNELVARMEALQAYNTTANSQSFGAIAAHPPTISAGSTAAPTSARQKIASNGVPIPSNVTGWFKLYGIKENLGGYRDKYLTDENIKMMKIANKSFAGKKETDADYYTSFGQALWNHKNEHGAKTLTELEQKTIKTEFNKWKNEQQTSPSSMNQLEEDASKC